MLQNLLLFHGEAISAVQSAESPFVCQIVKVVEQVISDIIAVLHTVALEMHQHIILCEFSSLLFLSNTLSSYCMKRKQTVPYHIKKKKKSDQHESSSMLWCKTLRNIHLYATSNELD